MDTQPQHLHIVSKGLFTIWGITINFNAILTTVIAGISWAILTWLGHTIYVNSEYIRSIPQLQQDILDIKTEQARITREYTPPVHP